MNATAMFKTHYSIGRSILTLEDDPEENGPDSVWQICDEFSIKELYMVEDSMSGFLKSYEGAKERNLSLRFGLRMTCENGEKSDHKIVIFALNSEGCHDLIKISSDVNVKLGGKANYEYLKANWTKGLQMVIPYYDNFLFQNLFTFNRCVPDFSFSQPVFLKEDNGLPFEGAYNRELSAFEKDYEFLAAKSIYYKKREDILAYQTLRCMNNRKGYGSSTLEKPELPHFCSSEFCIESWAGKQ